MSGNQNNVIMRFNNVSFAYNNGMHEILEQADFSIRENTKISLMGQNGAGKSTMFKLITGELKADSGKISIVDGNTIAIAKQVMSPEQLELTIQEFFATAFEEKDYQLDKKIKEVLEVVNFDAPMDKKIKDYSGGQQARLLLAYALIQHPDILLLDEPTNNLDAAGIGDLISFLFAYDKTVLVISHDADFLNMFTDGVLYLNKQNLKVEQYWGDYYDVVEQIQAQIEKEQKQNARAEKKIEDAKDKINFFANKGGKMRKLAKKMRSEVAEAEENLVEVRKDDKTIANFVIPFENFVGPIVTINTVGLMSPEHKVITYKLPLEIKKNQKYILEGPNGIGKSTLLKRLMMIHEYKHNLMRDYNDKIERNNEDLFIKEPDTTHPEEGKAMVHNNVRVAYYSQDFSTLDPAMTVRDSLENAAVNALDEDIYRIASMFMLTGSLLKNTIGSLSEGQKGLLCYAQFVLKKPHLLILDEPTNHINFRHLPVIAKAINDYQGAVFMVSHDVGFTSQLEGVESIDLSKLTRA